MTEPISVTGLGTALPPHPIEQPALADLVAGLLADEPEAAQLARTVCQRSHVRKRRSCLPDFSPGFGGLPFGAKATGTDARMQVFREHAPAVAEQACRAALATAGLAPDAITHLIAVTSTGFFSPGTDVALIERLGLPRSIERALVGFMGCEGFPCGLQLARRIATSDPAAVVLLACVELPTLHFRRSAEFSDLVGQALFGDAAGALVLEARAAERGLLTLGRSVTRLAIDPRAKAGWEIGDRGLRFELPPLEETPWGGDLREHLAPLLAGLRAADELRWCVHPADPRSLKQVGEALGLPKQALAASWDTLENVGNVISPGTIFALERCLAQAAPGDRGVMLGVRPGLSVQACGFTVGTRRTAQAR